MRQIRLNTHKIRKIIRYKILYLYYNFYETDLYASLSVFYYVAVKTCKCMNLRTPFINMIK